MGTRKVKHTVEVLSRAFDRLESIRKWDSMFDGINHGFTKVKQLNNWLEMLSVPLINIIFLFLHTIK